MFADARWVGFHPPISDKERWFYEMEIRTVSTSLSTRSTSAPPSGSSSSSSIRCTPAKSGSWCQCYTLCHWRRGQRSWSIFPGKPFQPILKLENRARRCFSCLVALLINIRLGLNGLQGASTSFLAHVLVPKKIKCCEYGPRCQCYKHLILCHRWWG